MSWLFEKNWNIFPVFFQSSRYGCKTCLQNCHTFDEKNEHMIDDKHKKLQTVHNWIGNKNKASTKTLQALDELFRKRK